MTEAEIEALEDPATWPEVFDERARVALDLANALSGPASHELEAGLIERLRRHYTEGELAELVLVAGQANLNNRAGNAAKQLLGPEPSPRG